MRQRYFVKLGCRLDETPSRSTLSHSLKTGSTDGFPAGKPCIIDAWNYLSKLVQLRLVEWGNEDLWSLHHKSTCRSKRPQCSSDRLGPGWKRRFELDGITTSPFSNTVRRPASAIEYDCPTTAIRKWKNSLHDLRGGKLRAKSAVRSPPCEVRKVYRAGRLLSRSFVESKLATLVSELALEFFVQRMPCR